MAAGNVGGTRDDLAGVWNDGLWVRNSADRTWKKIDPTIPIWLTVGDMTGEGRADIIGSYSTGTWYRNSATGSWTKLTTPASHLAAGDLNGDGKDDLIGIWPGGVYVRYAVSGQWTLISSSKLKWIAAGKMTEAILSAGDLQDPEGQQEYIDLSAEGPGGHASETTAAEPDSPETME